MKSLGENPTEEEIKKIIDEVDLNKNGTIEFNEFVEVSNGWCITCNLVRGKIQSWESKSETVWRSVHKERS